LSRCQPRFDAIRARDFGQHQRRKRLAKAAAIRLAGLEHGLELPQ
jgi:hypothetical protein